ncbi:hypothetical protein [Streptomyces griseofuscus]|uniref:Uncharacterized protein n=1 Tax=Streptomyces griseofuscus TaxID=146922 RepID=A0A3R8RWK9_9ACTN|nr:hypothetical protein [Streptomyces griseofuscus]RRQ81507.1 hypothetical protein CQW44_30365 [Streptomyces griseofuscus]
MSDLTSFVVMIGDTPIAVATDREAAQGSALTRQTQWAGAAEWEYRWDDYIPGRVWRLMQRRKGEAGKGRRFSWTTYSVHAVESLGGAA